MNKLLIICVLLSSACHAATAPIMAAVIANNAATTARIAANNSAMAEVRAANQISPQAEVKGAMTCNADYTSNRVGYAYYGCRYSGKHMSLADYFRNYKPLWATTIVSVVFNDHTSEFIIYFK